MDKQWQANKAAADAARSRKQVDDDPSTEENDDDHTTDVDPAPQEAKPRAKKRGPKAPKPKIQDIASSLAESSLASSLAELCSKYAADDLARGEAVAALVLRAFEPCELPFNKLLTTDFPRAVQQPWMQVAHNAQFVQRISDVLKRMDLNSVGALVVMVLDALVDGQPMDMPLSVHMLRGGNNNNNSNNVGGKAAPPRAKVGALLMMAFIAHAHPWALVTASGRVAAGGTKYTASGRVLILLWVFAQFHRYGEHFTLCCIGVVCVGGGIHGRPNCIASCTMHHKMHHHQYAYATPPSQYAHKGPQYQHVQQHTHEPYSPSSSPCLPHRHTPHPLPK